MPYGFKKTLGGDSPANDSLMESCVQHLMGQGKDKITAIKICKASLQRSMENKRRRYRA